MKRKIILTGCQTIRTLRNPFYQGAAAEMGFYFIFSIVPILTIMLQILSYFDIAERLFNEVLNRFAENQMASSLLSSVQSALASRISLAFIVVALWSASKIEFSMIRLANFTYRLNDGKRTGYVQTRLRAIIAISALIVMMIASLLFLVYGNMLVYLANSLFAEFLHVEIHIDWLLSILRWPIALVAYWFFLAMNYKIMPSKKIPIKHTIPGSLFAAVGILVTTIGYYIYFQYFSNYNLIYGSLAAVIALLFWFYLISYILILGMIINAQWFAEDKH